MENNRSLTVSLTDINAIEILEILEKSMYTHRILEEALKHFGKSDLFKLLKEPPAVLAAADVPHKSSSDDSHNEATGSEVVSESLTTSEDIGKPLKKPVVKTF